MQSPQPIHQLPARVTLLCVLLALVLLACDHGSPSKSNSEDEQSADASSDQGLDTDAPSNNDTRRDQRNDELTLLDEAPWSDERIAEAVAACKAWHATRPPPDLDVDRVVDCSSGDCSVDVLLPNADRVPVEVTVTWERLAVPSPPSGCAGQRVCQVGSVVFVDQEGEVQAATDPDGESLRQVLWLPRGMLMDVYFMGDHTGVTGIPAGELRLEEGLVIHDERTLFYAVEQSDGIRIEGGLSVNGDAPRAIEDSSDWGLVWVPAGRTPGTVSGGDLRGEGTQLDHVIFPGSYDVYVGIGLPRDPSFQFRDDEWGEWDAELERGELGYQNTGAPLEVAEGMEPVQLKLQTSTITLVDTDETADVELWQHGRVVSEHFLRVDEGAMQLEAWSGDYGLVIDGRAIHYFDATTSGVLDMNDHQLVPLEVPLLNSSNDVDDWAEWQAVGASVEGPHLHLRDYQSTAFPVQSNAFQLPVGPAQIDVRWQGLHSVGKVSRAIEVDSPAELAPLTLDPHVPFVLADGDDIVGQSHQVGFRQDWVSTPVVGSIGNASASLPPGVYDLDYGYADEGSHRIKCEPVMGTEELRLPRAPYVLSVGAVDLEGFRLSSFKLTLSRLDGPAFRRGRLEKDARADSDTIATPVFPGFYRLNVELTGFGVPPGWATGTVVLEIQ